MMWPGAQLNVNSCIVSSGKLQKLERSAIAGRPRFPGPHRGPFHFANRNHLSGVQFCELASAGKTATRTDVREIFANLFLSFRHSARPHHKPLMVEQSSREGSTTDALWRGQFGPGDAVTQLEKGTFDGQEQDNGGGVNAKFDAEKSPNRRQRDVVARAKLRDEVHDDFLNQVCAVGDTGDEGRARNCNPTKR